jgi:hypothetical protein
LQRTTALKGMLKETPEIQYMLINEILLRESLGYVVPLMLKVFNVYKRFFWSILHPQI